MATKHITKPTQKKAAADAEQVSKESRDLKRREMESTTQNTKAVKQPRRNKILTQLPLLDDDPIIINSPKPVGQDTDTEMEDRAHSHSMVNGESGNEDSDAELGALNLT